MLFGQDVTQIAIFALVAVAVGGVAVLAVSSLLEDKTAGKRLQSVSTNTKQTQKQSLRSRLTDDPKDTRRRQIQESLNQVSEQAKQRRKKITLRTMLSQAGLDIPIKMYWIICSVLGAVLAIIPLAFGLPWYVSIGAALIGVFGLPRWIVKYLINRRQEIFLTDFADAIDVMVRGLKSGLPVNDAMRIIANESGPPVGPEFMEVVEGQRVGIPLDVGVERLAERMPLPEVNFLGIVMTIQAKTGGNLSEALANLSKVLRDRKKMKAKVRAVSQEAKSSAAIIGALPFVIGGLVTFLNPPYLLPLFNTETGNMFLIGSGVWMLIGILVMRKMINIDI